MDFETLLPILTALDPVQGVTLLNVYDLPDELARVLTKVMRGRALSVAEFAEVLGLTPAQSEQIGDLLVEKGFLVVQQPTNGGNVEEEDTKVYRVLFERSKRRNFSSKVWDNLDLDI